MNSEPWRVKFEYRPLKSENYFGFRLIGSLGRWAIAARIRLRRAFHAEPLGIHDQIVQMRIGDVVSEKKRRPNSRRPRSVSCRRRLASASSMPFIRMRFSMRNCFRCNQSDGENPFARQQELRAAAHEDDVAAFGGGQHDAARVVRRRFRAE